MADQRPARRPDHPAAGLRAALRRASTPSSSTRRAARRPDPRLLITGDAQPTTLSSGSSTAVRAVAAGVRNPLTGAQLRSAVTSRTGRVVDLTGLPTDPAPVLSGLRPARLDPRASCVPHRGDPRRRRAGDIDGVPPSRRRTTGPSFDPDAVPAGRGRSLPHGGALHTVTRAPAPGPAGTGAYGLTSAAVSADPRPAALVPGGVRARRSDALRGALRREPGAPVLDGRTLSRRRRLDPAGGLGPCGRHRRSCGCRPAARRRRSRAHASPGSGRADVLQLSPDGVRAALVVDGPARPDASTSAVAGPRTAAWSSRPAGHRAVAVPGRRRGVAEQRHPARAGRGLGAGPHRAYAVGVDGWGLTRYRRPACPASPVHRRGADPAAAGRRRRHDLAAGRGHLGDPGPRRRTAARDGALLPL